MLVVVSVTGVVVLSGLVGELLGGSSLGAGVQVLDLGLAKDTEQGSAKLRWDMFWEVLGTHM